MPRGASFALVIIAALVLGFILGRCIGFTIPGGSGDVEMVPQLARVLESTVHEFPLL